MEYIKVAKVDNVILHKKGIPQRGTLHLTTHHLIFSYTVTSTDDTNEFWFPYPMINAVFKNRSSALTSKRDDPILASQPAKDTLNWISENVDLWSMTNIKVIGKDYTVFSLDFVSTHEASDVFDSLLRLTVLEDIRQLYAFIYVPNERETQFNSWTLYDVSKEAERQGLKLGQDSCPWRITDINQEYKLADTYPQKLIVPTLASDTLLTHASKYRSKARIPVLCYSYRRNKCVILRSSQPLPGITKQRSIQDEKLLQLSFECSESKKPVRNLVVDARPMANALAQIALGGGIENMDNYKFPEASVTKRLFLGIDNIHVMSDTMSNLIDSFLIDTDVSSELSQALIHKKAFHWLRSVELILSSVDKLVKSIVFNNANILVHCSDGWDRTAQICSLIQLCIDPYYRTFEGFMVLIEKDWVSLGHRFAERCAHLSSSEIFHDNSSSFSKNITSQTSELFFGKDTKQNIDDDTYMNLSTSTDLLTDTSLFKTNNKTLTFATKDRTLKFASPIFQQFLDCVYQLHTQNPTQFEFNERFLRRLVYHVYSCQYGTFLFNSECERQKYQAEQATRSVWDYFRSRKDTFQNKQYQKEKPVSDKQQDPEDLILPELNKIKWWWQLYGRRNSEMNGPVAKGDANASSIGLVNTTKDILSSFNFFSKR
ncbi:phosphatidylinositol-3-phosphatase YMR1 KNAG_0D01230 [Huiozyma naganishii CBS 8797]|uniref:Myotubularin phosphatase domain-containing protein n=1 Tax=Huiozyma naganishii (strain ATCC MYA-139 / BCRC 22969 / CBS 8797 / KCTC 17520 / NBRC 10181 / NCYC 3082 / Yp74L-3) TaxID=1071383 RepID=J7R4V3_HUIN7|nr:hypothetical protein KNAG_0D01230 [Kazachstania naganishii CBS 8797]CCK69875.1 hypothetical protein KNAG_0D01230 [Kazachstania naganishii CBS 8797]